MHLWYYFSDKPLNSFCHVYHYAEVSIILHMQTDNTPWQLQVGTTANVKALYLPLILQLLEFTVNSKRFKDRLQLLLCICVLFLHVLLWCFSNSLAKYKVSLKLNENESEVELQTFQKLSFDRLANDNHYRKVYHEFIQPFPVCASSMKHSKEDDTARVRLVQICNLTQNKLLKGQNNQ